jgi:8-oxo-dGTP pyrophosphatase MutT (NUDIX family)
LTGPETPAEAASRELFEETGLKVPPGQLRFKGTLVSCFKEAGPAEKFYIFASFAWLAACE